MNASTATSGSSARRVTTACGEGAALLAVAALARTLQGDWKPGAHPWLYRMGDVGPWVLAVIIVFFVGRALMRQRRYRARAVLGPEEQRKVHAALVRAETRTVGEVVPVVLERSDPYPGACWLAALVSLLVGSALLEPWLPWDAPYWLILAQLALGAAGYAAACALPDLRRLFVGEARADAMVEEQAFQEFYRAGLHRTAGATGVLLFVSLFERRVVVLGDEGIDASVGAEHWAKTREAILAGIARGSLAEGLVAGIDACGAVLAEHFPVGPNDPNEIPDRLIVRRE